MKSNKLFIFLNQLPPDSWKKLDDFLKSPFFNKNERIIRLWEITKPLLKQGKWDVSLQTLFKHLYPRRPYNNQIIKNLMSQFMHLLETFMATVQLQQSTAEVKLHSLEFALQHQMDTFVSFKGKQLKNRLKDQIHLSGTNYYHHFRLFNIMEEMENEQQGSANISIDHLIEAKKKFHNFSLYQRLRLINFYRSKKRVNNTINEVLFEEEWRAISKELENNWSSYQEKRIIRLYYWQIKMFESQEGDHFFHLLVTELDQLHQLLDRKDLAELYISLQNYCIRHINKGNEAYKAILFEIYQKLLAEKDWLISEWVYKNITTTGCHLGHLEWVESFLNKRKADLPAASQSNAYQFNLATLRHYQGRTEEVIQLLQTISLSNPVYYRSARFKLISILYQTREWERLAYSIEAFRISLIRDKEIDTSRKKQFKTFLSLVKKLINIQQEPDWKIDKRKKLESLKSETTSNELPNRSWLLQSIEEAISRFNI